MEKYQEACDILTSMVGQGKDNVIALATISKELSQEGLIRPVVRDVDAMYEDGVFYIVTDARSNKVKEIEAHKEVAVSANFEDFHSHGVAKNLGWVLKPENAALREKLMKVFEAWYVPTNDESDINTVFVEVRLTEGTLRLDHEREFYYFNFADKSVSYKKL